MSGVERISGATSANFSSEKYLPALKCLLASRQINADHPRCHEQSLRLKLALDNLSDPLDPNVKQVIESTFLSGFPTGSLEDLNEKYLDSHKSSASHVHSVIRSRNVLEPGSEEMRAKSARDLESTLELDTLSLQEAEDGLRFLDEINAGTEARASYVRIAQKRFPEASAFQTA